MYTENDVLGMNIDCENLLTARNMNSDCVHSYIRLTSNRSEGKLNYCVSMHLLILNAQIMTIRFDKSTCI